jgi:hypothetical protein
MTSSAAEKRRKNRQTEKLFNYGAPYFMSGVIFKIKKY